jgi:hypothetical protein
MIDLDELPFVSGLSTAGGVVADLVLNSGDLVFWLPVFLVNNIGPLTGILVPLNRLAVKVGWRPTQLIGDLVTLVLWVSVVVSTVKLLTNYASK